MAPQQNSIVSGEESLETQTMGCCDNQRNWGRQHHPPQGSPLDQHARTDSWKNCLWMILAFTHVDHFLNCTTRVQVDAVLHAFFKQQQQQRDESTAVVNPPIRSDHATVVDCSACTTALRGLRGRGVPTITTVPITSSECTLTSSISAVGVASTTTHNQHKTVNNSTVIPQLEV